MARNFRKRKKGLRRFIIVLIALILLCDSRFRLTVSEYECASPLIGSGFDGFRIVQLSDLHGTVFGDDSEYLLRKVKEARPDMIALTGDLADSGSNLSDIKTLLLALTELAPVYYISGNHEWVGGLIYELDDILGECGVTYLQNEYVLLERGGDTIALAGVEDPNGWKDMPGPDEVIAGLRREQGDIYTVLLGHRNYWVEEYPALPVELILCGHAHGGIVRLPFVGAVIGTGYTLFPEYTAGEYRSGTYSMIVSRGLGSSVSIPRFFNPPEIVCITLKSA